MAGKVTRTRGKQKIEMKQILNEDRRVVTFSKRKGGIFKKANELTILTGSGVLTMMNSPSGKPFTFTNDSIEKFANQISNGENERSDIKKYMQAVMNATNKKESEELIEKYNTVISELDRNKEIQKELEEKMRGKEIEKGWWSVDINNVRGVLELKEIESKFMKLRMEVIAEMEKKAKKA